MELAVASVFVSPIVKPLIAKVSTYCSDEIALVWNVKGELKRLARTLILIEAVLHDAEKRQVERNRLVKIWLGELEDVAHDAEDVLAELQCKLRRLKIEKKPIGFGYTISHKIRDVNRKLDEITKNMKKFNFNSQLAGSGLSNTAMEETSSHINDPTAVVGRNNDLSEILDLLSNSNQESYSVVRITGMGGLGKTTLAQLVYAIADDNNSLNDPYVIKMWVSVSRKSTNKEIFCDLLPNCDRQSSLNHIVNRLEERLMVGKCLIVLDDVWIDNGIDIEKLLKDLLSMSFQGSKILMTMRSAEPVPPKMGCRYKIYQLQGLSEDDCWSIIAMIAFSHGGAEETANLINIGKQIVKKCGGLPLAAKTLGGLLYFRKNNAEEWSSILNNQIWNLPTEENKIISLLKFSYDHLSPYVKRCFSYCSVFPKGYNFMKNELILLWLAEGFLSSPSSASPKALGNEYFKILLLNSFFQDERKNKWGDDIRSFRMHDLVHDLAISIGGSGSRMVKVNSRTLTIDDDAEVIMQPNKFRRFGLQFIDGYVSAIPSDIYEASKLRTFVSFCPLDYEFQGDCLWAKHIFSLSLLRVLNLSHTGVEELPQSISKLKHLRYLDISHTRITTFPSSFSQLYNLQTLRLKGCNLIQELPQDIRKLIGLEYLIFSNESKSIVRMPRDVSRLSELKKLSIYVVGTDKGYGIEGLKDLNLLGDKLTIENLGSVSDATKANLKEKEKMVHLQLRWDSQSCVDSDRTVEDTNVVINDLQPHENLRRLSIFFFGGSEFPTWMSTSLHLPNLLSITLQDCPNCKLLPALGQLKSLNYLLMQRMGAIKKIGNEFYQTQSNEEASFPSLVELYLRDFFNLEEWFVDQRSTSTPSFSCLETLEIIGCEKLSTTPTRFPSLNKLDFEFKLTKSSLTSLPLKLLRGANNVLQTIVVSDCDEFVGFLPDTDQEQHQYQPDDTSNNFLSKIEILTCLSLTVLPPDFRGLNSLTYLAIEGCPSLKSLPDGIQYLPALQTLIIGGFSEDLESFPFPVATGSNSEQYFISLRELTICGWPTLWSVLPDQLQLLTSLHSLNIRDFPCLPRLPEWFGELSSLHTLDTENCERLQYLPTEEQMLRLTSLEILNIRNCPLLLERCRFDDEEWHKIAHLKQVSRSSPSLLDHITRDADMSIELLERRSFGICSNQNKEKCWIDALGRNCFMLFPRSFYIEWGHDTRYWTWRSVIEPSASGNAEIEVPDLVKVSWLHVEGRIVMSKLSPGVNYEVVFVVMFQKRSYGRWGAPVNLCLVFPSGQRLVRTVNLEVLPKSRLIEIHVGDFRTPLQRGDQGAGVNFIMYEHVDQLWKTGLIIEGAIVRPKKEK